MTRRRLLVLLAVLLSGCIFSTSSDDNGRDRDLGGGDMPGDLVQADGAATCGDGLLQGNETCDPNLPADSPGACPESCDDGEACTNDFLVGSAATCDAACSVEVISACQNNDGCCPSDCTPLNDSDCDESAVCGDGQLAPAETCDPGITSGPGSCPVVDDCAPIVCESQRVIGSRSTCDAQCEGVPIALCLDADGCCANGCDSTNDDDCVAGCGNGVIDPGELCDGNCPTADMCDDGNPCTDDALAGDPGTCNARCTHTPLSVCMNGDMCCPANCNPGNDSDCSATCNNGTVDPPNETCDDSSPVTCPTSCDDGNDCTTDRSTGSPANCNVVCNNDVINACQNDDGCCPSACNANNDSDCAPVCGNNVTEQGETCDGNCPTSCNDNNACTTDSTTGSTGNCTAQCLYTDVTTCVDNDGCCPAACNANNDDDCGSICGNGITEPGETCDGDCPASCDDNNPCTSDVRGGSAGMCNVVCANTPITMCVDGDGCCPNNCNSANDDNCSASCGNGVVDPGEQCDGNCPTLSACQMQHGACAQYTGNAATCTARCQAQTGCVTCSLTGNCPCPDNQVCTGSRCEPSAGDDCAEACDPDKYCGVFGPGDTCSNFSTCIDCTPATFETDCDVDEMCVQNQCVPATSCNVAADPDQYCIGLMMGFNACNMMTGQCMRICQTKSQCGPVEACIGGWCVPAQTCNEAAQPEEFCGAEATCVGTVCRPICFNPINNCECSSSQTCNLNHNPPYCDPSSPPTHCTQVCPNNGGQNQWCTARHGSGWFCGVGFMQLPDGCGFGSYSGPDLGDEDMGGPGDPDMFEMFDLGLP